MTSSISPSICKLPRLSQHHHRRLEGHFRSHSALYFQLALRPNPRSHRNRITGELPSDIGRVHRLTVPNITDNLISGKIPPSITNLSSLMHLDLRNNRITDEIPRDFGQLTMLSRALINRNQIEGTIPDSISKIHRLADLALSLNWLSSTIPESLGRMAVLGTLNLDSNRISGYISASLLASSVSNCPDL
ncbi:DNA damage-repair/toleration protein DRT100-like [Ziziphus jujuba]|uniref:DNA damage-repair/toleration protein DRT100-like n=1 Tax=Ziziphus jujuba TaxID=326968 RepID=A0ABM4A3C4_ZIZJJ|nr:DNA damage-repair/toleration protein DRT100-like [Ziziphus jujuba]